MKDRFLFKGKVIRDANGHEKDSWVTGFYSEEFSFVGVNGECLALDKRVKLPMIQSLTGGTVFVYPETVGQCTGLKDKNGKLIYEGDILRAEISGDAFVMAVRFGEHKAVDAESDFPNGDVGFYAEVMGKSGKWARNDILFWVKHRNAATVGNIYENPELLGGADNV
jgi:hypothetical protein